MILQTKEQLALFNRRDRQIFDLVFRHYYVPVKQYAYRTLNNEMEAEDIAMQVFMELLKPSAPFNREENIKAWLFWRAGNRCLDFLELEEKRKALTKALIRQFKDEENNNAQLQHNMQATDALIEYINQLPGKQRQIAQLYFFKNLSRPEIAEKLNTSLNNVTRQLNYSIQKIKKRLGNA